MNFPPSILLIVLSVALLTLIKYRPAISARPNGGAVYRGLQTTFMLAWVALFGWQMFAQGFEMGGE